MRRVLPVALSFIVLPGIALVDKGSGTDRDEVDQKVEATQRDSRSVQLLADGRGNMQAFDARRHIPPPIQASAATGSLGDPARRWVSLDESGMLLLPTDPSELLVPPKRQKPKKLAVSAT